MPWTPRSFKEKHNKGLSSSQAKKAAKTANAVLKRTGDDATAIRIANAKARAVDALSPKHFNEK